MAKTKETETECEDVQVEEVPEDAGAAEVPDPGNALSEALEALIPLLTRLQGEVGGLSIEPQKEAQKQEQNPVDRAMVRQAEAVGRLLERQQERAKNLEGLYGQMIDIYTVAMEKQLQDDIAAEDERIEEAIKEEIASLEGTFKVNLTKTSGSGTNKQV